MILSVGEGLSDDSSTAPLLGLVAFLVLDTDCLPNLKLAVFTINILQIRLSSQVSQLLRLPRLCEFRSQFPETIGKMVSYFLSEQ